MSTTRIKVDPDDPATFPEAMIDPVVVDATTEAELAVQQKEDDAEAMQDMALCSPDSSAAGTQPDGLTRPRPPRDSSSETDGKRMCSLP